MKKTLLSVALFSALLQANEAVDQVQLKADIAKAKEQKKAAEATIKSLEAKLPADDKLVTHTELGYIKTSGNTKTQTFNLDAKVKKGWGKHIVNGSLDAQYADDDGKETKNKFLIELKYDYQLTKRFAFEYIAGYKDDKFSGFTYQAYTGPGANYKVIEAKEHKLAVDGNILYSIDSYDSVYVDANGKKISYPDSTAGATLTRSSYDDSYAAYRVKGVYNWQVLENLKFDQELSFRGSLEIADRYFVYSKTALSSKISDIFSAGLSYKVDYVNLPADGKETTDTTITANLIIDY